jgi:hypothetical protein
MSKRKTLFFLDVFPKQYKVTEVKGTKITAKQGQKVRTRNVEKIKVLVQRPAHLKTKERTTLTTAEDSEDEDWLEDMNLDPPQRQAREAEDVEAEAPQPQRPDSSTDEDEDQESAPEEPEHREVRQLEDALSTIPDRLKRASNPPKKLEQERAGEDTTEMEREISTGNTENRWRTPLTTPDTSVLEEEQGQPEREQPRAALAPSPTPVLHAGPAGQAGGVGPTNTGNREEKKENANPTSRMDLVERQTSMSRWLYKWLTPGGLVNLARVELIDPTWGGTDEPGH